MSSSVNRSVGTVISLDIKVEAHIHLMIEWCLQMLMK